MTRGVRIPVVRGDGSKYASVSEAAVIMGVADASIINACANPGSRCAGWEWRWATDDRPISSVRKKPRKTKREPSMRCLCLSCGNLRKVLPEMPCTIMCDRAWMPRRKVWGKSCDDARAACSDYEKAKGAIR